MLNSALIIAVSRIMRERIESLMFLIDEFSESEFSRNIDEDIFELDHQELDSPKKVTRMQSAIYKMKC